MAEWWATLSDAQQIFYFIAICSTGVLVLQLLTTMMGMGDHGDLSGDVGVEHPSGLKVLSLRAIVAFFVGFGWSGAAMLKGNHPLHWTLTVAFGTGAIFLLIVMWLMKVLYEMSESGNIDYKHAAGQTGTVYIPIPAACKGSGQVQVVVEGRMREVKAITDEKEKLTTGTAIEVVKMVADGTLLVRKITID